MAHAHEQAERSAAARAPNDTGFDAASQPLAVPSRRAGDAAYKLADQRYLWSVVPCLMGWPTVAMPLAHAAGIQVRGGARSGAALHL